MQRIGPDPFGRQAARLLDLVEIDRELVRRGGLARFMKLAWPEVEPADPLLWNWHHDAMCEHVEAVIRQEIRNVLINVPPGFTKSMTVSVMGSAFAWTINPSYRILAISHADKLARRDSRKVRSLIQSRWFQDRWPTNLLKEDESRLENDQTGFRIVGSVNAGVIGERGNLILVDDPLSREHAESEAHRRQASEFFWETLPTRVNDFRRDGKIVIMQRLHQADTSGEILERAQDNWECLILPNEYDPTRTYHTSLGFRDPRTREGELLHEDRIDARDSEELRSGAGIGARAYAGQYQQRPAPKGGAIVKEAWLANRFRERGERPIQVVQSWDCASKPAERNDPSACGTFALFRDRIELWHVSVKRQEFPDLVRRAQDLYAGEWGGIKPSAVLIEDKDAGQQLLQQLRRDTRMPVIPINPGTLDKLTRLDAETPFMEAGNLWLPAEASWVAHYVEELTTFPGSTHKDQVDMTSQLLRWVRERRNQRRTLGPQSVTRTAPTPV